MFCFVLFFLHKHFAPQEDKIICTWLLRGALHKDHFSKITAWLAFIPYFWKPSCFLRLPLLPLLPPPSLSCFSFHMLVLFFLIFPLCKKWKAENRMSEGGKKAGGKSSDCTSVKSLSAVPRLFSSLHWQLRTIIQHQTPSIYIIFCKPNLIHRQHKMLPMPSAELLYNNAIVLQLDERNSIDQP